MGPFVGPGPQSVGAIALRQAGEAFFGAQWQTEMAAALSRHRGSEVNPAHVRRWNAGGRAVPIWVFEAIEKIAAERKAAIDFAIGQIMARRLTTQPADPGSRY